MDELRFLGFCSFNVGLLITQCLSVHHRNLSKRGESFGISRIGSKIKGVFKSTTMEGAILPPSAMNDIDDDLVSVSLSCLSTIKLKYSIRSHFNFLLPIQLKENFLFLCL